MFLVRGRVKRAVLQRRRRIIFPMMAALFRAERSCSILSRFPPHVSAEHRSSIPCLPSNPSYGYDIQEARESDTTFGR